jgi:hypothetical protein
MLPSASAEGVKVPGTSAAAAELADELLAALLVELLVVELVDPDLPPPQAVSSRAPARALKISRSWRWWGAEFSMMIRARRSNNKRDFGTSPYRVSPFRKLLSLVLKSFQLSPVKAPVHRLRAVAL